MLTFLIGLFSAQAVTYQCMTEFGESVALRQTVLKPGYKCEACAEPGAQIAEQMVDSRLTKSWNKAVETDPELKSKIKRVRLIWKDREVYFDWRYAKRAGPAFKMTVACAEGQCSGQFLESEHPAFLELPAKLYDERVQGGRGFAEFNLSHREVLDLRVRVSKQGALDGRHFKVSASGEHMILDIRPKIIHDVGVDEYINLVGDLDHRIAALELKIRCDR